MSYGLWRGFAKLYDFLGGTGPLLPAGEWPEQTVASDTFSWFGPVGLFLVAGTFVVGFVGYRRGVLDGLGLLLATVQSALRAESAPLLRYVEEHVPRRAPLVLLLGVDDLGYPMFGPRLERRVELVASGERADPQHADWLVADPTRADRVDRMCWRQTLRTSGGWSVFRVRPACTT